MTQLYLYSWRGTTDGVRSSASIRLFFFFGEVVSVEPGGIRLWFLVLSFSFVYMGLLLGLAQLALKSTSLIDKYLYLSTIRKNNVHLFYEV